MLYSQTRGNAIAVMSEGRLAEWNIHMQHTLVGWCSWRISLSRVGWFASSIWRPLEYRVSILIWDTSNEAELRVKKKASVEGSCLSTTFISCPNLQSENQHLQIFQEAFVLWKRPIQKNPEISFGEVAQRCPVNWSLDSVSRLSATSRESTNFRTLSSRFAWRIAPESMATLIWADLEMKCWDWPEGFGAMILTRQSHSSPPRQSKKLKHRETCRTSKTQRDFPLPI